jgi:hypothetical protein
MIDMNMAATKTTPTATFWLIRDSTGVLTRRHFIGNRSKPWRAAEIPARA